MSKILQSYLRFWAKRYLKRVKPKIIAVTGSAGKTSTKEAIFEVLKVKFVKDIRRSPGNLNNQTGMSLAILGFSSAPSYAASFLGWIPIIIIAPFKSLQKKVKILVLEMAADSPGNIEYLIKIAKPNIAVITTIGPAHLEAFKTIEAVFAEKIGLLKALSEDELAILNADDEHLSRARLENCRVETFGLNSNADIIARNITTEINNFQPLTRFQIVSEKDKFAVEIRTLGRQVNIYPALAAASVAKEMGLSNKEIVEGLKNLRPEKHRMEVKKAKNEAIILDDCYNANPLSMKAALNVLKDLPTPLAGGRKIAVLGEMRELGAISKEAHRVIGEYARAICNELVSYGQLAREYRASKHFEVKKELIDYLLSNLKEGDILLIKASRGAAPKPELEEIVEALKA